MRSDARTAADTGLPDDTRNPRTRFFGDIRALARMASITTQVIESALAIHRGSHEEHGIYVFRFSGDWIEDINFAVNDVMERAASLDERCELFEEEA